LRETARRWPAIQAWGDVLFDIRFLSMVGASVN
jgi:hypothetical protein